MKVFEIIERTTGLEKVVPAKVKPIIEPFPKKPETPAQPTTDDNGTQISPTRNGGVKLGDGRGTFIWDKNGQPSMYISPAIGGLKQVHNIKNKTFVVNYSNQGFDIKATYDQQGNKISDDGDSTSFSLGGASAKQEGNTISISYNFGPFSMETKLDASKASPKQIQNAKAMAQEAGRGSAKSTEDLVKMADLIGGEVIFKNNGKVISQEEGIKLAREMFSDV